MGTLALGVLSLVVSVIVVGGAIAVVAWVVLAPGEQPAMAGAGSHRRGAAIRHDPGTGPLARPLAEPELDRVDAATRVRAGVALAALVVGVGTIVAIAAGAALLALNALLHHAAQG